MAAWFRGAALSVRCNHRELCRVVWRPQAAVFSSKPPDRKLPRRTHIKKAKAQPTVDVAKLLDQLFSQRRPDTAPPAAAKASSISPKTSSGKVSTSTAPPAASSVSKKTGSTSAKSPQSPQPKSASSTNPKTVSETPQPLPLGIIQELAADGAPTTSASRPSSATSGPEAATEEYQTKVESATEAEELPAASAPRVENDVGGGEPLMETTTEPSAEATLPALGTRASPEGPLTTTVDATVDASPEEVQVKNTDLGVGEVSLTAGAQDTVAPVAQTSSSDQDTPTVEPLLENTVEASVEPTIEIEGESLSHAAFIQNAQISEVLPLKKEVEPTTVSGAEATSGGAAAEEEANESEQMTLESVTLGSVKASVGSWQTDELLQTKRILDDKADETLQEMVMVQTGVTSENSSQDERGSLTEVLSKWDSLSEDLQELEGESGTLVKELLCGVPAGVPAAAPETPAPVQTSWPSDRPVGGNGDSLREEKATEEEAMMLEEITLAEVMDEVGSLESKVLQEASDALEKEAEVLEKEQRIDVKVTEEAVIEDSAGAEILTLDSISEAADAIEAEASGMLGATFGFERGPQQPPDSLKVAPQEEMIGQEAEKESGEQEESVSGAMSLESVMLAGVEASLGTLENQSLSEATAYLEREAGILAVESRTEAKDLTKSDDVTEDGEVESLSLAEADALFEDAQTCAVMEELLFTAPGQVAGVTEARIGPEAVRAEDEDAPPPVGPATVDAVASPTPTELLPGREVVEEGGRAEASGTEGTGTNADLDPVQRLFLEKIREYNNIHRLNGGTAEAGPDYERHLAEETAKLQRLFGGGDLSSFPRFTFTEPDMDQDCK